MKPPQLFEIGVPEAVADRGEIMAVSLLDSSTETVASGMNKPWGLSLSLDGKKLYVAETGAAKVSFVELATGKVTDMVGKGMPGISNAIPE